MCFYLLDSNLTDAVHSVLSAVLASFPTAASRWSLRFHPFRRSFGSVTFCSDRCERCAQTSAAAFLRMAKDFLHIQKTRRACLLFPTLRSRDSCSKFCGGGVRVRGGVVSFCSPLHFHSGQLETSELLGQLMPDCPRSTQTRTRTFCDAESRQIMDGARGVPQGKDTGGASEGRQPSRQGCRCHRSCRTE